MDGGHEGPISIIVRLLLLPFEIIFSSQTKPTQRDQELAKASRAAAMMLCPLLAVATLFGPGFLAEFLRALRAHPDNPAVYGPALVVGLLLLVGVLSFASSAKFLRLVGPQPLDGRLSFRAVAKIGLGVAAFMAARAYHAPDNETLENSLKLVALWCVITGAAKFLLLRLPYDNEPDDPLPEDEPRRRLIRSRDMSEAEALRVLQRGNKLPLDDREF